MSCKYQGCILLKNITLPQSVVTVGSYGFKGCISLEKIELSRIKEINPGCFNGCVSLEYIQIPNSVTEISGSFDGCSSLKTLSFESGNAKLRFPRYLDVFKNCPLDSIFIGRNFYVYEDTPPLAKSETLHNVFVSDSVTYLSASLLRDCKNLENIYGMNNVDSIGEYCFAGTKIKKFCAPSLRTFGGYGYAFDKCQNLEELVLGKIENVTGYWIGDCPNLRNIYIGTELKTIGSTRFFEKFRGKLYIFSDKLSTVLYQEAYDKTYTEYGQTKTWHYPAQYGIPPSVEAIYVASPERYQSLLGKFYNMKPMLSFKESTVEYSGKTPELTFVNNVDGYDVTFDKSTTPSNPQPPS